MACWAEAGVEQIIESRVAMIAVRVPKCRRVPKNWIVTIKPRLIEHPPGTET
jgi:hypothetical protein